MKYRVVIDIAFDREVDAKELFDLVKSKRIKLQIINEGKQNEEMLMANYHKCYHDEEKPKPCEIIEQITKESI